LNVVIASLLRRFGDKGENALDELQLQGVVYESEGKLMLL